MISEKDSSSQDDLSRIDRTALIGVLVSLGLGVVFSQFAGDLANGRAIWLSVSLGLVLQLSLWFLNTRFRFFGKALVTLLFALLLLSFIPGGRYLLAIVGLGLGIEFFRQYLRRARSTDFVAVILPAVACAATIFFNTARNYADPLIDEKIRQFVLHEDTLYHTSISSMWAAFDLPAVGIHGLRQQHYHLFVHFLYSRTSEILNIEPYQVFGYSHLIAFAPLLFCGYLSLLNEFKFRSQNKWTLICLVAFGCGLSGMFGWQTNSFYTSESYQTGLILLAGGLSVLNRLSTHKAASTTLLLVLIVLMATLAKISVGVILAACAMVALVLGDWPNSRRLAWMGGVIVAAFLGYLASRTLPVPGLDLKFELNYALKYWHKVKSEDVSVAQVAWHYMTTLAYAFVGLPIFIYLAAKRRMDREGLIWFGCLFVSAAIGLAGLNITIVSSGAYFSNVHTYVAMPAIAWLLGHLPQVESFLGAFASRNVERIFATLVLAFLVAQSASYLARRLPMDFRRIVYNRAALVASASDLMSPYLKAFAKIKLDPERDYMVYIPKVDPYWGFTNVRYTPWLSSPCARMPYYIPILTGRPALFGLPDRKNCRAWFVGYENYTPLDFKRAANQRLPKSSLCKEVLLAGFKGYFEVTRKKGAVKIPCSKSDTVEVSGLQE